MKGQSLSKNQMDYIQQSGDLNYLNTILQNRAENRSAKTSIPASIPDQKKLTGMYYIPQSDGSIKKIDIQNVVDMPEKTRYEKTLKQKAAFKLVDDILDNLPQEKQGSALKAIGMDATSAAYYNVARQTDDAKYSYILDQMDQYGADRQKMMSILVQGRMTVNDKMIVSNSVVDDLYNDGYISSAERTALKKLKLNSEGKQTRASTQSSGRSSGGTGKKAKEFIMSTPPEISNFILNSRSAVPHIKLKPLSAEFFTGQIPGGTRIPKAEPIKIEDLIKNTKTSGVAKARQLIQKLKAGSPRATGPKLSKSFFRGNRSKS